MSRGNQHSRSAKRNCPMNSPPYGYGGLRADIIVLPVRIIMSPTCSSRFFVGRNALSATARTTQLLLPHGGAARKVSHRNREAQGGTHAGPRQPVVCCARFEGEVSVPYASRCRS